MKKYWLQLSAGIVCVVAFFAFMGVLGDYDYTEQIILRMSYDDYEYVKDTLTKTFGGRSPSEREIAHWWEEHHNEIP